MKNERGILSAGIALAGVILAAENISHLLGEGTVLATVLGGIVPVLLSVGVVAIGIFVYLEQWALERIRLLSLWGIVGIGWMLVVAVGLSLYLLGERSSLPDAPYLFAMFASYGTIPAFLTGWYDIRRQESERSLQATNENLRTSRDFLNRVEEIGQIGGWEIDLTDGTVTWTDGGRQIHEFSSGQERPVDEVLASYKESDRQRLEAAIEECRREGTPIDLELQMETVDGSHEWVHVRGERDHSDEDPVIRGAIQNITIHKQRQQRLTVLNRVLRHNIRNDITIITGNADLVDETIRSEFRDSEVRADVSRQLATIKDTADGIVRLAEKTHIFEQVVDIDEQSASTELRELVEDVVTGYRTSYPNAVIEVSVPSVAVQLDDRQLRLIVDELLENAVGHQESPPYEVTVTGVVRGPMVSITIEDTGPGLPEDEQTVIESGRETPLLHGSGIGLWIVNWLTTRNGGTLSIADTSDAGTAIVLSLPLVADD